MYFNNIKPLTIGLLLINSMEFIYANDNMHMMSNEDILCLKQNLQSNMHKKTDNMDHLSHNKTVKIVINKKSNKENKNNEISDDNELYYYNENYINNKFNDNKKINANSDNDEIDNLFENWNYNEKSETKNKYKKLSDKLLTRNITQLQKDVSPSKINVDRQKQRKLSNASKSSVKSHFSNPLNISHKNVLRKIDELLNSHEEIIPIITLQSDGLQVLDTIAHLLAFNSFYNLNNFGQNPYIFCASSASIPGLSLALDLQNQKDPTSNLSKIGDELIKTSKSKTENIIKKKCIDCNCNAFKLIWLSFFGCCIDYDEDNILDSLYIKIPNKTANNILTNILDLNCNSDIKIPNLVIKDVNYDSGIVHQVIKSNNSQDAKSNRNQIKLFVEPFVSVIKHFVDSKKPAIEKGIKFVENKMNNHALIKISSRDEENFIQQKNLNDSTVDRLFIILSSNVDNSGEIQHDTNKVEIEYKEVEYEKLEDNLHEIKINLYTANSIMNQNYSLEEKINNVKSILDNSSEFKYLINHLPQVDNSSSSIGSSEELKLQNISDEE